MVAKKHIHGCVFCLSLHQLTHYLLKCLEKHIIRVYIVVLWMCLQSCPLPVPPLGRLLCSNLHIHLQAAVNSRQQERGGWPSCVTSRRRSRRNRSFHPQAPLRLVNGPHWRGSLRLCKEDSENKGSVQHNLHKNNVSNKFSPRTTAFELQNLKENCVLLRAKTR